MIGTGFAGLYPWVLAGLCAVVALGVAIVFLRTARRLDAALRLARERSGALAHQTAMIERITGAIEECFYTYAIDADERVRTHFATPGWGRLLGLEGDTGDTAVAWNLAVHPDDAEAFERARKRVRAGHPTDLEFRVVDASGRMHWLWARERPVGEEGGDVLVDGVVSDISARKAAEGQVAVAHAEAERLSLLDDLTGIFNRRHFGESLVDEMRRPERPPPAVLLIDLDHFKRVNDEHGHLTGDAILQAAAGRIASILRRSDCLARWGGEEFAILARGTDRVGALRLAERARHALAERPVRANEVDIELRASIGVAVAEGGRLTPEALVSAADEALYEAKHAGRDCVRLADGEPEALPLAPHASL